jgi:hypothetical protein
MTLGNQPPQMIGQLGVALAHGLGDDVAVVDLVAQDAGAREHSAPSQASSTFSR